MKKKGAALLTVVIIVSVIFIVAVAVLDRSIKTYRDSVELLDSDKSYYAAESLVYDMVGYIDSNNNSVPKGTEFTQADGQDEFKRIELSDISTFDVKLTTDVVNTYNDSSKKIYTYNIESKVKYKEISYVVKMQVEAAYDTASKLMEHRIIERKAYKI